MEKKGLNASLHDAGCADGESLFWSDEMRLGLIGQLRRVWASRGVKVVQRLEYKYQWAYLNLAVNGVTGSLLWSWTADMKAISIAPVVKQWACAGLRYLVWDRARGHHGDAYDGIDVERIFQPPYSPELNPAERVFEYLRDRIEGFVYGCMAKKKAAVERELEALALDPERVRSLAGWSWIRDAVSSLT